MRLEKAKKIADRLVEIFTPHCDVINIAGSVRREKEECKDIEIVCLPKEIFHPTDLFGGGEYHRTKLFSESINQVAQKIIKGKPDGRMMQIELKGGMMLDLFMPVKEDYFRQFAIRTGSADYAAKTIADGWRKIGWCGTTNAGLRQIHFCIERKSGWFCCNLNSPVPPAWQSEEEFFEWLQVPWIPPAHRTTGNEPA